MIVCPPGLARSSREVADNFLTLLFGFADIGGASIPCVNVPDGGFLGFHGAFGIWDTVEDNLPFGTDGGLPELSADGVNIDYSVVFFWSTNIELL